jgi:group I intron endonuclease
MKTNTCPVVITNNLKSGIYKIKNLLNNKIYIGSSLNIKYRINSHKRDLANNRHCNKKLQNSYNKYGLLNFSFEPILYCERTNLMMYEQLCIDITNCVSDGFNILITAGSPLGIKFGPMSQETKLKISIKAKSRPPPSESQKLAISKTLKGYSRTVESRIKQSESSRGSKKPSRTPEQLLATKELRRKLRQDKLQKEKELKNE